MTVLKKKIFFGVLLTLTVASLQSLWCLPTGKLEAWVMDIGQGDATLLQSPAGFRILVDGGPDSTVLQKLPKHLPLLDRRIDLVVLTHPDSDHSKGILEVLRRYSVRSVLLTGMWHDTETYRSILEEIHRRNIPVLLPDPTIDLRFSDGLTLDILWPLPGLFGKEIKDTNNAGVVFIASAGERSILMTGDIEAPTERKILQTGQAFKADILKVAHHGSKNSSGSGFLLEVSPKTAVISSGKNNSYGHPHRIIVDRLMNFTSDIHVTAENGEFSLDWKYR